MILLMILMLPGTPTVTLLLTCDNTVQYGSTLLLYCYLYATCCITVHNTG